MTEIKNRWSEREQLEFFGSDELAGMLVDLVRPLGLQDARVTVVELHHRPGAGVSGVFEAATEDAILYLGATAENLAPVPDGVVTLSSPHGQVEVWLHPADPRLPGLALATTPESVQKHWGNARNLIDLRTLTYRPLRRAVLKATFDDTQEIFLKVLRKDGDILFRKHQLLGQAGIPVPELVGPPLKDVLAFEKVRGVSMAEELMHGNAIPLRPETVLALLDGLPAGLMDFPARPAWSDRLGWYGHAALTTLPEEAQRIGGLVQRLGRVLESSHRGDLVPTHGDFYEANIFVELGSVAGLLDIDSAGPGYLVDDLACFLGHLFVLPVLDERYGRVPDYFETYATAFARELESRGIGADGLFARAACVVLSLVAGARDEQNPQWRRGALRRLELVEKLLARIS